MTSSTLVDLQKVLKETKALFKERCGYIPLILGEEDILEGCNEYTTAEILFYHVDNIYLRHELQTIMGKSEARKIGLSKEEQDRVAALSNKIVSNLQKVKKV